MSRPGFGMPSEGEKRKGGEEGGRKERVDGR